MFHLLVSLFDAMKLPLKSLIGGLLVAASTVVCALAYTQADKAEAVQPQAPILVENEIVK